jgi:hypothetical protein
VPAHVHKPFPNRNNVPSTSPIIQQVECTEGYQQLPAGPPTAGSGPSEQATNVHTKSKRLALSCGVTWAWFKKVNSFNQQIYYREAEKHIQRSRAPGPR